MKLIDKFQRKTNSTSFIAEVDGLRFFAIITVVVFHLNSAVAKALGLDITEAYDRLGGDASLTEWGWWIIRLDLGVKVFFAISGFVLALPFLKYIMGLSPTNVNIKLYFVRRLTRLEPPYIISMLLFFMVHLFVLHEAFFEMIKHFVVGLFYGHTIVFSEPNPINPVTWSLETEAQFYILVPLLFWVMEKFKKPLFRLLMVIALIFISGLLKHLYMFAPIIGFSILTYFMNFGIGILVCWLYLQKKDWFVVKEKLYDWLGLGAILGLFYFYKPQADLLNILYFNGSLFILFVSVFKGRILNWFFTRKPIYIIGGMCYSIYLIHYAFFHLSTRLTALLWIDNMSYSINLILQMLINIPLILFASGAFFLLFEKPFMSVRSKKS
jgi:peptidoglycan/LPS O-acetylase OafA/YrhL